MARARAMATRWRWPPDSSLGRGRVVGQADQGQQDADAFVAFGGGCADEAERDLDVLGRRQDGDQAV
ncbi:hypothetical protein [Actinomadura sp. 7K507]|uniref:hypothetical protein n=1 Tax=Actinomadura sp. 7K507 TaxID=2530365 RepID=UPI001FB5BC7F|nr:hypothetical protein [Actinomadura sp. 7K507]